MPPPATAASRRPFRVMLGAAVALFCAGAFAAIVHDGGDDGGDDVATLDRESVDTVEEVAEDPAATSSSGPAGGDAAPPSPTGDTTAPGAENPGPAPGGQEPGTPAPASPPPNAPANRQLHPVPAGTYQYATDGTATINGDERRLPQTTTLQVPPAGDDGRQTTTRDLRDTNGDGSMTETTLRFAPEGVFVEMIKSTVFLNRGAVSQSMTLTPTAPFLLIPADAGPGTKTTGQLRGDGIVADVTFEVLQVNAEHSVSRLIADLSGEVQGRQTSELTTRASDLLTVKEVSDSDVRSGPFRVQSRYTATLR